MRMQRRLRFLCRLPRSARRSKTWRRPYKLFGDKKDNKNKNGERDEDGDEDSAKA